MKSELEEHMQQEIDRLNEGNRAFSDNWVLCADSLPELGDYSVLCYFAETDAVEMVHVEDYFRDITAGLDEQGNQRWTKWYLSVGITHWHEMPLPPNV